MVHEVCSRCAAKSPPVASDFTLLGASLGWRVARRQRPDGATVVEWFCPECWRKRRAGTVPPGSR